MNKEHVNNSKNYKNRLFFNCFFNFCFTDQSNSSVEKGAKLASVIMKFLTTDEKYALRGETLLKAVKEDLKNGLIPCCVIATLGTTGTCAFDNLKELGPICKEYNMWLHIDAAYAGQ